LGVSQDDKNFIKARSERKSKNPPKPEATGLIKKHLAFLDMPSIEPLF